MITKLFKFLRINLIHIFSLINILSVSQYAFGDKNLSVSCSIYKNNHDYMNICRQYKSQHIKLMEIIEDEDISSAVSNAHEDHLLIFPPDTYKLKKPLKTKYGQGILPYESHGFIKLVPYDINYNIIENIFTVFEIGEKSKQGGIEIDVDSFKYTKAFKNTKEKVLVYSYMIKMFEATWIKLKGSYQLSKLFWADNKNILTQSPNEIMYTLSHSYIEGMGAEVAVKFEMPQTYNPNDISTFNINSSVITVGVTDGIKSTNQTALHIINGAGDIEHGCLVFSTKNKDSDHSRTLLHLENSDKITIKGMVFYSNETTVNKNDLIFNIENMYSPRMKVIIMSNSMTGQASKFKISSDFPPFITINENYYIEEHYLWPQLDYFFIYIEPCSGNQLTDRFLLQDMTKVSSLTTESNIEYFYNQEWSINNYSYVDSPLRQDPPVESDKKMWVKYSGWAVFALQTFCLIAYACYNRGE